MATPLNQPEVVLLSAMHQETDSQQEVSILRKEFAAAEVTVCASRTVPQRDSIVGLIIPPAFHLTCESIHSLHNLRFIGVPSVGTDHVEHLAAAKQNIRIVNAPGFNTEEVAEHTLAFVLMLVRGIPAGQQIVQSGKWLPRKTGARRIDHCVVGIVGFGSIGQRVAQLCATLGMKVLVWNRSSIADKTARCPGVTQVDSLKELLSRSDVVSLHLPDVAGTHHLMNAESLALMKQGSYLVNVSRGGLVDEDALIDAINRGRIAGAAIDVLSAESPKPQSPILSCEKVVVTPHCAWYSPQSSLEGYRRVGQTIATLMLKEGIE